MQAEDQNKVLLGSKRHSCVCYVDVGMWGFFSVVFLVREGEEKEAPGQEMLSPNLHSATYSLSLTISVIPLRTATFLSER